MNVAHIDYSHKFNSLDIYVSGCKAPYCSGCHNPELWDFNVGKDWEMYMRKMFFTYFEDFGDMIERVTIFGGDLLDQDIGRQKQLLNDVKKVGREVWLFTKYDFEDIPEHVKFFCDYIKTGRFIENLKVENNIHYGIELATSNQKIYKKGIDYYGCKT
ncbi:MAG: 4Fe-4S cluster-binding domain-containing protein [archaeon]